MTCVTLHTKDTKIDTTIRNIDDTAYRAIKARAALEGRSIGELVTDAIQIYLCRPAPHERDRSLRDWKPSAGLARESR